MKSNMPATKTNDSIVGYPYHTTDGVAWRHSQYPGVFAIPHSELTKNPAAVLDFMQKARWPLAVEHGWEPIAMASPFRSDTVEMLGSTIVKEVSQKQFNAASVRKLKASLGRGALVLALGKDSKPGIIMTQFTSGLSDEFSADYAEIFRTDDEAIAAGNFMHDPETGQAFFHNMVDEFAGSRLAEDMQYVHQRRI